LKTECQHFVDCIRNGGTPLTSGQQGLDLVRILEASSESLKLGGAMVHLDQQNMRATTASGRRAVPERSMIDFPRFKTKNGLPAANQKLAVKIRLNGA